MQVPGKIRWWLLGSVTMALASLQATQTSTWIVNGGSWNTAANWDPAVVPNGSGDTALFTAVPGTGTYTVTSATDITLGFLLTSQAAVTFSFGANRLICDDPTSAKIVSFVGTNTIDNEVLFMCPTIIQADGLGKRWTITGPLTSGAPLARVDITGGILETASQWQSPSVVLSGINSSAPPLNVFSGCLAVTSAIDGTPVAPKNITLSGNSSLRGMLRVIQGSDIFPHDSVITCEGGFFSVTSGPISGSPASTDQTIGSLIIRGGSVQDTQGAFFSGSFFSTLTMNSVEPITIGGDGTLAVQTVVLGNPAGGTIRYDNTVSGRGYITSRNQSNPAYVPNYLYLTPLLNPILNSIILDVPSGGNADFDLEFSNIIITNGELTKTGNGIVLFTGKLGSLPITFMATEGTSVFGNNFTDVIGSTGKIILTNKAKVKGIGRVGDPGSLFVNAGGVVSPGYQDEPGTLTIGGDYRQVGGAAPGILQILANGTGYGDVSSLVVNGSAFFDSGAVIQFLALDGGNYTQGASFPIVTAEQGLVATIDALNQFFMEQAPYHVDAELSLQGNQIWITLNPLPSLTTLAADSGALDMAAENMTFTVERQNDMHMSLRGAVARADERDVEGFLVSAAEDNPFATGSRFKRSTLANPWTVYVAPVGSKGMVKKIREQNALDFHSLGAIVGADYTFTRVGIGANIAYEKLRAHVHEGWGHFSVSNVLGRAYATMLPFKNDHFFLDLSGAVGSDLLHVHRNVNGMVAKGSPRGWTFNAYGQVGYDFLWSRWRISPVAYCNYTYYIVEDYMETGAGSFNVHVGHQNVTSLVPALGVNAGSSWETGGVTWLPEVRFNWERECCDINHKVKVTSLTFDTERMVPVLGGNRDFFDAGAGLRVLLGKHWGVYGSYDFYWSQYLRNNVFYGEIRCYF